MISIRSNIMDKLQYKKILDSMKIRLGDLGFIFRVFGQNNFIIIDQEKETSFTLHSISDVEKFIVNYVMLENEKYDTYASERGHDEPF